MAGLVDSHCHLDAEQFDADRDAVLARAIEAGVAVILNPGVDLPSSRAAVELAARHDNVYAAVGIHPHDATTLDTAALQELRELASVRKVVAIGEIGLDYYRDLSPRDAQRRAFAAQLDLAAEMGLPVIIHSRDAHEDVIALLAGWQSALATSGSLLVGRAGVMHSFSGDQALAERMLALGLRIGVSGPVTYPKADRLRDVVRSMPEGRLLIETDSPYLPPQTRRGQRNEPAYVSLVAQAVASVRSQTVEFTISQTSANARDLFRWPDDRHP